MSSFCPQIDPALRDALSAAVAFKESQEAWFAEHSGEWKNNTKLHRRTTARHEAEMLSIDKIIAAITEWNRLHA